jgi:hypothetical protein
MYGFQILISRVSVFEFYPFIGNTRFRAIKALSVIKMPSACQNYLLNFKNLLTNTWHFSISRDNELKAEWWWDKEGAYFNRALRKAGRELFWSRWWHSWAKEKTQSDSQSTQLTLNLTIAPNKTDDTFLAVGVLASAI